MDVDLVEPVRIGTGVEEGREVVVVPPRDEELTVREPRGVLEAPPRVDVPEAPGGRQRRPEVRDRNVRDVRAAADPPERPGQQARRDRVVGQLTGEPPWR